MPARVMQQGGDSRGSLPGPRSARRPGAAFSSGPHLGTEAGMLWGPPRHHKHCPGCMETRPCSPVTVGVLRPFALPAFDHHPGPLTCAPRLAADPWHLRVLRVHAGEEGAPGVRGPKPRLVAFWQGGGGGRLAWAETGPVPPMPFLVPSLMWGAGMVCVRPSPPCPGCRETPCHPQAHIPAGRSRATPKLTPLWGDPMPPLSSHPCGETLYHPQAHTPPRVRGWRA